MNKIIKFDGKNLRQIPEAFNYYITNNGEIYSYARCHIRKPYKIKHYPNNYGYPRVGLYVNGRLRHYLVHRLVLSAFVGPCPIGFDGLHKDDNPSNCNLSNLYWGTKKENYADMIKHGKRPGREFVTLEKLHKYYLAKPGVLLLAKIARLEKISLIEFTRIFSNKNGNCIGYKRVIDWIKRGMIPGDGVTIEKINKSSHYHFNPIWVKNLIEENIISRKSIKLYK